MASVLTLTEDICAAYSRFGIATSIFSTYFAEEVAHMDSMQHTLARVMASLHQSSVSLEDLQQEQLAIQNSACHIFEGVVLNKHEMDEIDGTNLDLMTENEGAARDPSLLPGIKMAANKYKKLALDPHGYASQTIEVILRSEMSYSSIAGVPGGSGGDIGALGLALFFVMRTRAELAHMMIARYNQSGTADVIAALDAGQFSDHVEACDSLRVECFTASWYRAGSTAHRNPTSRAPHLRWEVANSARKWPHLWLHHRRGWPGVCVVWSGADLLLSDLGKQDCGSVIGRLR